MTRATASTRSCRSSLSASPSDGAAQAWARAGRREVVDAIV